MLQIKSYGKFELITKIQFKKIYSREEPVITNFSVPYKKTFDLIKITKSNSGKFEFFTANEEIFNIDNTVVKAAEYFFTENPTLNQGIKIILEKNFPLGSGLSLSSSNAVATYKLLHEYYRMDCSELALMQFARVINPAHALFFIANEPALIKRNGKAINLKPEWTSLHKSKRFVLEFNPHVCPDAKKVTEHFFNNYRYYKRNKVKHGEFYNELELVTFDLFPELHKIYNKLKKKYNHVLLSGTGSTFICF